MRKTLSKGYTTLGASLPEDGSTACFRNVVLFKTNYKKGECVYESYTIVKAPQCSMYVDVIHFRKLKASSTQK